MRDVVLRSFVKNYMEAQGISGVAEEEAFGVFAVATLLRKYHALENPNIDGMLTDGEADGGIDAIAILVNGRPVFDRADVDFLCERARGLRVEFVFFQTKSSPSFTAADIGTFGFGVEQFFASAPAIPFRDEIVPLIALKDYIYERSGEMDKNPGCHLYYVSTGTWNTDPEPSARAERIESDLAGLRIFDEVSFTPIDAERLKADRREIDRGVVREVEITKTAVFPKIDGVDEAYIGLMAGDQFLNLASDDLGAINRNLFYDNVRDFQGPNPVNRDIAKTLANETARGRFAILNNGITVVARSIKRTGDMFRLSDFQIVNGCQTSHVLFKHRDAVGANMYIPVKLLATSDSSVVTEVIKATNWQTAVLPEALESLSPFHKELEDYYTAARAKPDAEQIYYERRSKQYLFENIPPSRIVTLANQITSFVAMFLNEPHSHHRYYGELLKAYESRLFLESHYPNPYCVSGRSLLIVDRLFNSRILPKQYRRYKHHIIMLLRVLSAGKQAPRLNSKAIAKYCEKIDAVLSSRDKYIAACKETLPIIDRAISVTPKSQNNPEHRLRALTSRLLEEVDVPASPPRQRPEISTERQGGVIDHYDDSRGFGFIRDADGNSFYFQRRDLAGVPYRSRHRGCTVSYMVQEGDPSPVASSIVITDESDEVS